MRMISFFNFTKKRRNGCTSHQLSLQKMSAKRASVRIHAINPRIPVSEPAKKRLMPSGANRMVPRISKASACSVAAARRSSRSLISTNLYAAMFRIEVTNLFYSDYLGRYAYNVATTGTASSAARTWACAIFQTSRGGSGLSLWSLQTWRQYLAPRKP